MAENFGAKFSIDITNLKKGLSTANKLIKENESQWRANAAQLGKWEKSEKGLEERIKSLQKTIELQETKVEALKKEYKRLIDDGLDPASDYAINFRTNINKETEALNKSRAELERNTAALKELREGEKSTSDEVGKLNDKIDKQEKELKDLKEQYAEVASAQGKNSTEAKELAGKISSLSGELKTNKDKMADAKEAADKFDKTLKDSSSEGGGVSKFDIALGNLAANGISKLVSGLRDAAEYAVTAFKEVDGGADAVIKQTGATGEVAEELQQSYKNVAREIKGDFTDIGNTLGQVNTRFGYTGTKLEQATKRFIQFADITGVDAAEAVRLVARALENAGDELDNYDVLLDKIAKASQASGVSVTTLAEGLVKNGAAMRALGFDTDETIALFAQFEKAGVNTETAFRGLQTAAKEWSAEGKDAKAEFQKMMKEIENAPSDVDRTKLAFDTFGKKAGQELSDAIGTGRFSYNNFVADIKNSKGTVEDTYTAVKDGIDDIDVALQDLKLAMSEIVDKIDKEWGSKISTFIHATANSIRLLPIAIEGVINSFKNLFNMVEVGFNGIVNAARTAWQKITDWFGGTSFFENPNKVANEMISKMTGYDNFAKNFQSDDPWGWKSTSSSSKQNMVVVPKFANGGIVKSATRAIIGEKGKEAVLPLESDTSWMDTLAEKLAGRGGVVVNQTNNYAAQHTRYEIFKSQQATARAVKIAMMQGG